MRKQLELTSETSCLNKAKPDEMLFVLLGRDIAAPATIRVWVSYRLETGKNKIDDPQIIEALQCACQMEKDQGL